MNIKDLTIIERPYEKCQNHGAYSLTDVELLSVLIGSGNREYSAIDLSREIYKLLENKYSSFYSALNQIKFTDLSSIKGMGIAKTVRILSALELGKRSLKINTSRGIPINKPGIAYHILKTEFAGSSIEKLYVLFVDSQLRLIKSEKIAEGNLNECAINIREILRKSLQYNCHGIILSHNHPSGNPMPSDDDIISSKVLSDAAKQIGIKLLDHIVIADNSYISIHEKHPEIF